MNDLATADTRQVELQISTVEDCCAVFDGAGREWQFVGFQHGRVGCVRQTVPWDLGDRRDIARRTGVVLHVANRQNAVADTEKQIGAAAR